MGPVEKLISKAKEMNFKLLLAFALLALAVAEAQKNGKQPKGPKGGSNGPKGPKGGPKGPKGPKDSGEDLKGGGGNGSKGGKGSKGPKGPGENGGNGGSGGNGKGPKGPGGNSGEDSGEVPPPGPVGPDSEIALCTGSCTCESGDTSKGFTTYGFVKDGVQRCFTVFHPLERAGESLPVVISSQCYGKDKLQSISMKNENAADNKAAARYGYARIGVSTPDGHWTFGNNNIVNDLKPMPCADEDSKDIAYMRKIMDFIAANPQQFDSNRVYTEGFSQNSMFSAYIGFCFPDNVLGVWQGGSGMAITGEPPNLPGCQGQVTASDFADNCQNCNACIESHPCTECQYWPVYPCYSSNRPMVNCLSEYTNDYISNDRHDPQYSTATNMYEKMLDEGHDPRLLRFSPSADETIKGGHQDPRNLDYWQVGCLGITESCTQACEDAFKACVESEDTSTALKRTQAFDNCMDVPVFSGLDGCTETCAPTFGMLASSETPITEEPTNFGAGANSNDAAPNTSRCEI